MNQEKYLERFQEIVETMYNITKAKNSDYAGENAKEALANFYACEQFGISAEHGLITRMVDKIKRVSNLIGSKAAVKDEKIEDTLLDLANYSIILLILTEQRKNA